MTLTLRVEQRHIDQGIPWSSLSCPIALALKEQEPGHCWRITCSTIYRWVWGNDTHSPGPGTIAFPLPEEARRFVYDLSTLRAVQPFQCEISSYP